MTFNIKQNDTSPAMLATLQDAQGSVIDLTGSTIRFHMRTIGSTVVAVDAPAAIVDPLQGLVRYNWDTDDTAAIGSYQAEFEVTYGDASVETFPNNGYIRVEITNDIA